MLLSSKAIQSNRINVALKQTDLKEIFQKFRRVITVLRSRTSAYDETEYVV